MAAWPTRGQQPGPLRTRVPVFTATPTATATRSSTGREADEPGEPGPALWGSLAHHGTDGRLTRAAEGSTEMFGEKKKKT